MDLLTPLGKDQRGLIVSPHAPAKPCCCRTWRTRYGESSGKVVLMVLLIDERPEESHRHARSLRARGYFLDLPTARCPSRASRGMVIEKS